MVSEKYKETIKKKTLEALTLWKSSLRHNLHELTDKKRKNDFFALIEEMDKEIRIRNQRGEKIDELSNDLGERPETGMLKFNGYKVGDDGESEEVRRDILVSLFKGPLPHVHSQGYMEKRLKENSVLQA